MTKKNSHPFRRSRTEVYAKQRKKNFILNVLIAVVFALIVIVGWDLLFGNKGTVEEAATDTETEPAEVITEDDKENNEGNGDTENRDTETLEGDEQQTVVEAERDAGETGTEDEEESDESTEELIIEESDDPNVIKTVIDPNWQPVGTVQTGEHVTQYDKNSVDWQEMLKAISYATGISEDNMTVWFIGRGEVPNKNVIGTVSPKDQNETYRVYLEWVDGQGWKPEKVEYLKENDKK